MKIIGSRSRPAGMWGDVVTLPTGGFAWFYSVAGAMVCEVNGAEVFRTAVSTDFLRFTRGTAVPGLFCIGQSLDDEAMIVGSEGVSFDGIAAGQNPVALGPGGTTYIVRDPDHYSVGPELVSMPHTSQGIRDVRPDGSVVLGDDSMHAVIGGHAFWQYQTRGSITVGQAGTNVGIGILHGSDYLVIPRPGDPLGVQWAIDGATLAVCAWTVQGAQLWLIDLTAASEPDPIPDPDEPEPKPVPAPNQIDTVRTVMRAHPEINPLNEDVRGGILDLVCAILDGRPWGRKSRNQAGTDLNTDALTYQFPDGSFEIIDVIAGSDPNPGNPDLGKFATWDTDGKRWAPGSNGYWVAARPIDAPSPVPVPRASPGAALDAQIAALVARVAALEARPVPSGQPPTPALNGLRVALKTDNGHYLCAEGGGGGEVNASRDAAGGWETFTLKVQP